MLKISDKLKLPNDAVTQTIVVYGGKGMGKTNFGSVLAEELHAARQRFSIIDPMGVAWGLQHGRNKSDPGLEVLLLGGVHGDLPIEPTAGEVVADLVADESISVVIDISRHVNGKAWSKGEKVRFVTAYMLRLYERQVETRRPIMQIIDEAARYAPQGLRSGDIDEAKCLGAIAMVCEEGRNLGIGLTLLTQRSARLNKDVAELADVLVAFRTVGPNSVSAVTDWLGDHVPRERHKVIVEQLRQLPVGSALVVSPGWLNFEGVAPIRLRNTFDSSATPKNGQALQVPGRATKPDLAKYRDRMQATIEKAKAADPKELKRQIAELQKQLAAKPKAVADAATIDQAVYAAVERRDREWRKSVKDRDDVIDALRGRMLKAVGLLHVNGEAVPKIDAPSKTITYPVKSFAPVATKTVYQSRQENPSAGGLSRMSRAFLAVLAQHPDGLTKRQILTHTDYASSGPVSTLFAAMVRDGWVDEPASSSLRITPAGLTALGPFEPLPKGAELRELRLSSPKLSPMEKAILGCLFGNYPNGITKREILGATGYKSSGPVSTTFAKFVRLGWAQQHGRSALKAADVFFE